MMGTTGIFRLFDETVQVQKRQTTGDASSGPTYGEVNEYPAKIEMEGSIEGTQEGVLGVGRIFLDTGDPPSIGDLLTLPSPYPRHPDIRQVSPVKKDGQVLYVVVYCDR